MKKMLRFVLLLIVAFGIAGGAGVWKVRQLAESKILIKDETIFTLKAGSGVLLKWAFRFWALRQNTRRVICPPGIKKAF